MYHLETQGYNIFWPDITAKIRLDTFDVTGPSPPTPSVEVYAEVINVTPSPIVIPSPIGPVEFKTATVISVKDGDTACRDAGYKDCLVSFGSSKFVTDCSSKAPNQDKHRCINASVDVEVASTMSPNENGNKICLNRDFDNCILSYNDYAFGNIGRCSEYQTGKNIHSCIRTPAKVQVDIIENNIYSGDEVCGSNNYVGTCVISTNSQGTDVGDCTTQDPEKPYHYCMRLTS
jgi:hypothetical protein